MMAVTPARTSDDRLTAIETELKHLATKEDLQKLKVWFLTAGLGAGGVGAALTWLVRLMGND